MTKFLWCLNIIGFIMTFCALAFLGYNKHTSDLLFWFGIFLMLPNWIYQMKRKNLARRIVDIIAIVVCFVVGYLFFTGTTIKLPGKEPITIVTDKENV